MGVKYIPKYWELHGGGEGNRRQWAASEEEWVRGGGGQTEMKS